MQTATIKIQGMTCQHCVQTLTQALTQAPGITSAAVDLAAAQAHITYDPAATTLPQILTLIKQTGFTPTSFTKAPQP